jgi:hypothetical protein
VGGGDARHAVGGAVRPVHPAVQRRAQPRLVVGIGLAGVGGLAARGGGEGGEALVAHRGVGVVLEEAVPAQGLLQVAQDLPHPDVPRGAHQPLQQVEARRAAVEEGEARHQGRGDDDHARREAVRVADEQARPLGHRGGH